VKLKVIVRYFHICGCNQSSYQKVLSSGPGWIQLVEKLRGKALKYLTYVRGATIFAFHNIGDYHPSIHCKILGATATPKWGVHLHV